MHFFLAYFPVFLYVKYTSLLECDLQFGFIVVMTFCGSTVTTEVLFVVQSHIVSWIDYEMVLSF